MTSAPSEAANGGDADQTYRQQLRDILAGDERSVGPQIQQVLQLGADRFGVALGLLVRVDATGETYTIDEVNSPHPDITRGLTGNLLSTYCRMVVAEQEPLAVESTVGQEGPENSAYQSSLLSTYIGTEVSIGEDPYGTVCFVDLEARPVAFDDDRSFLASLAQTIERLLCRRDRDSRDAGRSSQNLSVVDRRYRTALQHSPVLFAKIDDELRYEWISNLHPTVATKNIIGKRDDELDSGPGIDRLMELKRRTLDSGEQIREEIVFEHSNGLHVFDVTATPLREGQGEAVTGLITAALNVTDRKEKERRLEESEARYRALAKNFPHGAVGVYDCDLRYTLVRGTLVGDVLPSREEFEGRRVKDIFPEQTTSDLEPLFRAAVEEGMQGSVETEFGGRIWKVWATPLRGEGGDIFAGLSFAQDVTEQKERETALRQQRNLLNQTQKLAGAWEIDLRTEEVTWSETVYQIHEVPPGTEIDLADGFDFYPPETRTKLEVALQRCIEEEDAYDLELRLVTAEGNRRWVRAVGAPAKVEDGTVTKVAGAFQDITERKEEERRRKQVIRRVTDAIVEVDADWHFTLVNDQAEALYDMEEEDLLGKKFWDVFTEARGTRFEETYRQVMETREPTSFVEYYSGLDGWFDIQVYPNDDGGIAFYFQDVTEQKQREARLRDLSNSIPGVVFQFFARPDGSYGFYFVSEHAAEVLGVSHEPKNFLERCLERIPDTHRSAFRASIDASIEEEAPWEFETPFDKPSGERRWILGRSIPRKQNGETVFNGVLLDITDRKFAERELRESERRFRKIFENAAIGIVIGDEEGHLLRPNPAHQSMMGYEEEELQKLHFSDITYPDDIERDAALFEELIDGKRDRYQIEKRYVRKDGSVFWGRLTVSLLDMDDGRKHVALVEDIDDQKRYEEQLREAKNEAEEAARLKSVMLANMSHEVRTPLTSMIGFCGILEDMLDGKSAKLARLIRKSGRRLEETLEAVLQLSQLEAGSYSLDRESLRLDAIVKRIANEVALQAKESGVDLDLEPGTAPVDVYADETAVRRVITNLVDNAIKFTPEGGQVTLRAYTGESGTAVLEVEDTGVGISEEALPEVFDAFKQESEGLTREYEGAGLGLSIVRELVETLGGRIDVDTEKGEGTCIIVHLPRTSGETAP